jgi:Cytochrome P460
MMSRSNALMVLATFGLVSVAIANLPGLFAQSPQTTAVFTSDGKLKLPTGYREWVFVGAPLTPNALNGGSANFPEFHHVYVEKRNLDAYLKSGTFPEGTVFIKELTRVLNPTFRTVRAPSLRAEAISTANSMA